MNVFISFPPPVLQNSISSYQRGVWSEFVLAYPPLWRKLMVHALTSCWYICTTMCQELLPLFRSHYGPFAPDRFPEGIARPKFVQIFNPFSFLFSEKEDVDLWPNTSPQALNEPWQVLQPTCTQRDLGHLCFYHCDCRDCRDCHDHQSKQTIVFLVVSWRFIFEKKKREVKLNGIWEKGNGNCRVNRIHVWSPKFLENFWI